MKNMVSFFAIVLLSTILNAQKNKLQLDTEILKKYTSYFIIEDDQIKGNGAKIIKDFVNASQFIVYGEMHGSQQTSKINKALMPLLASEGFNHFAIEVGPHSTEKLTELSTPAEKTIVQLNTFNSKYSVTQGKDTAIPIPFFDSVGDAEFLLEARRNGMSLWGLDQEYFYSAFFLLDEMANTSKGQSNYTAVTQKRDMAKAAMYKYFIAEAKGDIEDPFGRILKDSTVTSYFDAFSKDNKKAQAILKDLKISWDIYINWRNDSHADRISYMRNNFMKHYNRALKTEKRPKVYTKIGGLHAKKILSNGAYDIGELVASLAQKNGTVATTIGTWRPYEKAKDGSIIDLFEKYRKGYKRYRIFMPLAKNDQWAIINLKAIRKALESGKIELPKDGSYHKIRQLLYAYDYQLILPVDAPTIPNRS